MKFSSNGELRVEAVQDTDTDVGKAQGHCQSSLSVSVNIISLSHILDFVSSFCSCCAAVAL